MIFQSIRTFAESGHIQYCAPSGKRRLRMSPMHIPIARSARRRNAAYRRNYRQPCIYKYLRNIQYADSGYMTRSSIAGLGGFFA